jgi:tetratricopeptide (TPR) repeat protein
LFARAKEAGPKAYATAAFDVAAAHGLFGTCLVRAGAAPAALVELRQARARFEAIAAGGDAGAERHARRLVSEEAAALFGLGRRREAIAAYERAIAAAEAAKERGEAATNRRLLGAVLALDEESAERARGVLEEARAAFEAAGDRRQAAIALAELGGLFARVGRIADAEAAFGRLLAVAREAQLRELEASARAGLGEVCLSGGRAREAAELFREVAQIRRELRDVAGEAIALSRAAIASSAETRHDEARKAITRALEVAGGRPGLVARLLGASAAVELAAGELPAAAAARSRAIDAYLAERAEGGEPASAQARLVSSIREAVGHGRPEAIRAAAPKASPRIASILEALAGGARDPALADDLELDYEVAAELQMLISELG